jgi:hypothetical protein
VQNTRTLSVTFNLTFPSGCSDFDVDLSAYLPVNPNDVTEADLEYVPDDYCPIGFTAITPIETQNFKLDWMLQADASAFAAEIIAHPNYTGGIALTLHEVQYSSGAPAGASVQTGYALSALSLPLSEPSLFYVLAITANFDFGSGVHEILHTLTVEIFPPVENDPPVNYDSNAYLCTDITATPT